MVGAPQVYVSPLCGTLTQILGFRGRRGHRVGRSLGGGTRAGLSTGGSLGWRAAAGGWTPCAEVGLDTSVVLV